MKLHVEIDIIGWALHM